MFNFLYKILLTFSSTAWVIVLFGIKEKWTIPNCPYYVISIILLMIPILTSLISVLLFRFLSKDELDGCTEIQNVNNSYIPTYLGYFFVGLSINDFTLLIIVYVLIFIFAYLGQGQYFNPIYLLFGYNFYCILTTKGTRIFIISKRNIKNVHYGTFPELRRLNESTYVEQRRKNESSTSQNKE